MSKLNNIKAMLQSILAQFSKITTDKGLVEYDGDSVQVGMELRGVDEEGNNFALENGDYKLEDGTIYVVADGKISEIREPELMSAEEPAAEEPAAEEPAAEEEAPAQEEEAPAEEPAQEEQPAEEPASEEEAPAVEEEAPAEEPEAPAEESEAKQAFSNIRIAFEATYAEKEMKIAEAIRAKGFDAWVVEASDSYAVAEVWDDEKMEYNYRRFEVLWDSEENPVIGTDIEVRPAFVPVGEEIKYSKIDSVMAELEEVKAENEELKSELDKPAAEPVMDEFENVVSHVSTDDKKLNNLKRYFK